MMPGSWRWYLTQLMNKFDCDAISQFLSAYDTEIGAPEFHGLMAGYLCANTSSSAEVRLGLYQDWLEARFDAGEVDVLEKLYVNTQQSLDEFSDFDFRVLVPNDDLPITTRSLALSHWCSGFLSGFGSAGRYDEGNLAEEVSEALTDFLKIAAMAKDVPDGEENEVDLLEISEYVRIAVLLIFTECGDSKPVH